MYILLTFLNELGGYAESDAYLRSNKHLPTPEDLKVNTKISGNQVLWKIKEDATYQDAIGNAKPELRIDKELVRKIYNHLIDTPEYKNYISNQDRKPKDEKEILEFMLNDLMLTDELFIAHMEENFMNWDDDADMAIQVFASILQKPGSVNFTEGLSNDKWDFAKTLLTTVIEKEEHLQTYIFPKLKNWDSERIAALDMIIMKMGVAEFLYFETIPPKVTINEYIDIAKEYSTQQSGQFVNGILDNIHKELVQEGKMQKKDFKKA